MQTAISFDFWNTLYADGDEPLRLHKRKQLLKAEAGRIRPVSDDEIEMAFQASTALFLREWGRNKRTPVTAERLQLMCDELDIRLPDQVFNDLVRQYGEMIKTVPPMEIDNARQVVKALAEKYPLGIISDTGYISGYFIRRFLSEQNMLQHFQSQIFSDEAGVSKPHVKVFKDTAAALGVPCERLIHIGDLEKTDVRGANECGGISVRFTGVNKGSMDSESEAHYHCSSYAELPQLIEQIIRENNAHSGRIA